MLIYTDQHLMCIKWVMMWFYMKLNANFFVFMMILRNEHVAPCKYILLQHEKRLKTSIYAIRASSFEHDRELFGLKV